MTVETTFMANIHTNILFGLTLIDGRKLRTFLLNIFAAGCTLSLDGVVL